MVNPAITLDVQVLELRQYTLRAGRREALIELFDREFVETQEDVGIRVLGQFRDLEAADRFVWLRGFRDMAQRAAALAAFYGGPVWAAHGEAANATMIDSDDVLLLHPARVWSGFRVDRRRRPPVGAIVPTTAVFSATVYPLPAPDLGFTDFFARVVAPELGRAGAAILGCLETEPAPNTFPRLPVREGEHVFVCLARFASLAAEAAYREALARSTAWRDRIAADLRRRLRADPQILLLSPTARSLLR